MPVILCFGDSNVWGNIPGSSNPETGLSGRYKKSQRWTGVLQNLLGEDFYVVEEAINGRTTNLDEITPGRPYKNGLALLPPCLESHYPIDVVIFMLGTNDTKTQYNRSPKDISEGMRHLVRLVKTGNKGFEGSPPKVLLIAPQPIIQVANFPSFDADSIEKSKGLAEQYQKLAKEESCEFLDAALVATSSFLDGVHLGEKDSLSLGSAVAKIVKQML